MSASVGPIADQLIALLPRLRRFARVLISNPHEADDLVQVAIERATTHFNQWRPGIPLESWLFGILRNAWLDQNRARRPSEGPMQRHSLAAGMEQLPEDQRLVVALVLVEGLAYKEAAEVLEVPMNTLSSRLARARATLEALLGGREAG